MIAQVRKTLRNSLQSTARTFRKWELRGRLATLGVLPILLIAVCVLWPLESPSQHPDLSTRTQSTAQDAGFPKDAEMISFLKDHRDAFKEMIDLYQSIDTVAYENPSHRDYEKTVRFRSLQATYRIRVSAGTAGNLWLDDPYSPNMSIRIRQAGIENIFHARKYHELVFKPEPGGAYSPILERLIFKSYIYMPSEPRVKGNVLLLPRDIGDDKLWRTRRLAASLDAYPDYWRRGHPERKLNDCIARQIEPQWLLSLCIV